MKQTNEIRNIADKLVTELTGLGVLCYIWHKATTGSVYIRFEDNRMGSVRLGDHPGRAKLKYKYNIRRDISGNHPKWVKDEGVWRYYIQSSKWKEIVPVLLERAVQVKTWKLSKYKYFVPEFKKKENESRKNYI